IFYILKFIAFSYSAALDPENGFWLSFLGYTLGVGLCEEFVKSIPLLYYRDSESGSRWRGLMIAGLASGAGFGIAEGIMYSSEYYNGVDSGQIYLVRFLSCVALHAIWTGSVAISIHERRDSFAGLGGVRDWIVPWLMVIAVPATLHGLYDTCLKKDSNGYALLVAFASFGYLAFVLSRRQADDDTLAQKNLLRDYVRRRQPAT
ncbi:MAG TPA: PrsW family glutamic-type intramembrane protease, partial [Pirellulales bacterium]|nr:PrsW family glutamic-type intramembrane protease [Pirellulales bacterium]